MQRLVSVDRSAAPKEPSGRNSFEEIASRVGNWWCEVMHDAPMWPIHGVYECRTCGRRHIAPWAQPGEIRAVAEAREVVVEHAGTREPMPFSAATHAQENPCR